MKKSEREKLAKMKAQAKVKAEEITAKKQSGPSAKMIIYTAFSKMKKKEQGKVEVKTLMKLVKKELKESTVRGWVNSWKKNDNIPKR